MRELGCTDYRRFVRLYVEGYGKLVAAAKGKLNILFGAELRFSENSNDYLLYGITPELMLGCEEMFSMNPKSFSEYARANGILFIQAHPFRNNMTVVDPKHLDGIEVFNGHVGHNSRNDIAEEWAKKHGLIMTSGTDFHHVTHFPDGGILTDFEIKTMDELVKVLKSGDYELIRDKSHFKDK